MEEKKLSDDALEEVSGGWMARIKEVKACENAMDRVHGKTCKFCHSVFDRNAVSQYYTWHKDTLYNRFINLGSRAVPCLTCGCWRFIEEDFE